MPRATPGPIMLAAFAVLSSGSIARGTPPMWGLYRPLRSRPSRGRRLRRNCRGSSSRHADPLRAGAGRSARLRLSSDRGQGRQWLGWRRGDRPHARLGPAAGEGSRRGFRRRLEWAGLPGGETGRQGGPGCRHPHAGRFREGGAGRSSEVAVFPYLRGNPGRKPRLPGEHRGGRQAAAGDQGLPLAAPGRADLAESFFAAATVWKPDATGGAT